MDVPVVGDTLASTLVTAIGIGVVILYMIIISSNILMPVINKLIRKNVVRRFENADVRIGRDIIVHSDEAYWEWAKAGSLGFGESYMAKLWDPGCTTIDEIVTKLARLPAEKKREFKPWNWRFVNLYYRIFNMQSVSRADIIAKKHYNLGNDFFKHWLDKNMQYSCGYWKGISEDDPDGLDRAQLQKMSLIAEKLQLQPGMTVLDIGCGWGTLACFLAQEYKVNVRGINISTEQIKHAQELAAERGLSHSTKFVLEDYRKLEGQFDRVVSVGMIEHVGLKNLDTYYDVVTRVLKPGGLALIQSITNGKTVYIQSDQWIHKYIFPNGYLLSPKLLAKCAESKLVVEDMQNLGLDYMRTLVAWHKRFKKCAENNVFDAEKQDETFLRMWEYYLLYCTAAFRARITHLYQVVYSKKRDEIYISPR